jgi:hypothetical protein
MWTHVTLSFIGEPRRYPYRVKAAVQCLTGEPSLVSFHPASGESRNCGPASYLTLDPLT